MWWSSGNSSQDQGVKDTPAAVASAPRCTPPHFESFSDALGTCAEVRRLHSFTKLLGRDLSSEQYEALIGSYEYLGSRTLVWGVFAAYPIWLGLSWRRRRANRKLREQVQYWKGHAEAAASFDARRVAARQPAQPLHLFHQAEGSGNPLKSSPAIDVKKHQGSSSDSDSSSREVWRPSASGWTKTTKGCKSNETRGSTSDAHAKWARAFGGGAVGSVSSRLDNENADWEALAAQRAHEQRWREMEPRADESTDSFTGTETQAAPTTSRPSEKSVKIKALLDKDQDLIREAGGNTAEIHVPTSARKGPTHTESVTAYPTSEADDFAPARHSLLDAFLEHAAEEGRLVREQQLTRTMRGGKYLLANAGEPPATSANTTSKPGRGRPRGTTKKELELRARLKSANKRASVPSDVDVILETEMAWLEESVARAEQQPSARGSTQGEEGSEELDPAIAEALAAALHPVEAAIRDSNPLEGQERNKDDVQAPGDAETSKDNVEPLQKQTATFGVESRDVSPSESEQTEGVDVTGDGKDSTLIGSAAAVNASGGKEKMQASEGETAQSSSSSTAEAQPTRRRSPLRQKTKLPPSDAEQAATSSSSADLHANAGKENEGHQQPASALDPSLEAGLRRVMELGLLPRDFISKLKAGEVKIERLREDDPIGLHSLQDVSRWCGSLWKEASSHDMEDRVRQAFGEKASESTSRRASGKKNDARRFGWMHWWRCG